MASSGVRRWSTALLLAVAACCALVSAQEAAVGVVAAPTHRAVVIVDDGVSRRAHCIVFSGEISGIEALEATPERTVLSGFGGLGSAVCSIGGTGCSVGQCLTCQAPKYWRYYRADSGTSVFRPSGGGASTSRVGDGDVEAWVWGNSASAGTVPTVDSVCGARPTTTTSRPAPTAPAPTVPTPTVPTPTGGVLPPGPTGVLPSTTLPGRPVTTLEPDDTTTTRPDTEAEDPGADDADDPDETVDGGEGGRDDDATDLTIVEAGDEAAAELGDERAASDTGGGWLGVLAVALVLGGVAAWALVLRRRGTA
jgi:hypothetical protein